MTPTNRRTDWISWFVVQGVLPIIVAGLVLPIGLVALFLAATGDSPSPAVSRGELFLAGGTAGFIGALVFATARQSTGRSVAVFTVLVLWVLPTYALWAFMAVREIQGHENPTAVVETGGFVCSTFGVCTGLALVVLAYPGVRDHA